MKKITVRMTEKSAMIKKGLQKKQQTLLILMFIA
jgi:hypothetical protein